MREIAHCYRCIYSWRPRTPTVRMCPRCKSKLWNTPRLVASSKLGSGQGIAEILSPRRSELLRLCQRFGVSRLRVFGSVARGEATELSDVDLLVEYSRPSDILERTRFRLELQRVLGRRVDLVLPETLHWAARPKALAEAVQI